MALFVIGPRSASGAKQRMFLIELGRCGYARRNRKILKERAPISQQLQCPLWVKSRHVQCINPCPLYPRKPTCAVQLGMSALCQERTPQP
jgi:hypothetical protein